VAVVVGIFSIKYEVLPLCTVNYRFALKSGLRERFLSMSFIATAQTLIQRERYARGLNATVLESTITRDNKSANQLFFPYLQQRLYWQQLNY
jgi:hypothetical protein